MHVANTVPTHLHINATPKAQGKFTQANSKHQNSIKGDQFSLTYKPVYLNDLKPITTKKNEPFLSEAQIQFLKDTRAKLNLEKTALQIKKSTEKLKNLESALSEMPSLDDAGSSTSSSQQDTPFFNQANANMPALDTAGQAYSAQPQEAESVISEILNTLSLKDNTLNLNAKRDFENSSFGPKPQDPGVFSEIRPPKKEKRALNAYNKKLGQHNAQKSAYDVAIPVYLARVSQIRLELLDMFNLNEAFEESQKLTKKNSAGKTVEIKLHEGGTRDISLESIKETGVLKALLDMCSIRPTKHALARIMQDGSAITVQKALFEFLSGTEKTHVCFTNKTNYEQPRTGLLRSNSFENILSQKKKLIVLFEIDKNTNQFDVVTSYPIDNEDYIGNYHNPKDKNKQYIVVTLPQK